VVFGYAHQTGDVVTDPSIPITGVDSTIDSAVLAFQQTIDLFGRTGNIQFELPYVDGTTTGMVSDVPGRRDIAGIGDVAATLTINLRGAPAMTPADFRELRQDPRPILGASIKVIAPTGKYEADRLINIGTNRWGFKPEIGVVQVMGSWAFDIYVGGWFFTDNSSFNGSSTRSQDPILSTQAHVRYRFRPDLWAAVDANYWRGGRSSVNGVANDDLQDNSRIGLTVAWQVRPQHGLRLAASRGAFTRIGGDFDSVGLSYSYSWMDAN